MTQINQPTKDILTKVASFLNDAVPVLEQVGELDTLKADHEKAAEATVDRLITAGLVDQANRDASITEIREGGISKYAGVINYVIENVATTPSLGKSASNDTDSKPLTADELWDRGFGLTN